MLGPVPVHADGAQSLADGVRMNLMIRPSFLMTDFRQHLQGPQTAFVAMFPWRLAHEFPQVLSGFIIVGSLIIVAGARLQFQATDPLGIECVQHFPYLLIALSNAATEFSGCFSLIGTQQDDVTASDGGTNRRFQPVFQHLALSFTRFSGIDRAIASKFSWLNMPF